MQTMEVKKNTGIEYLFQTLEKEWERSGKTVVKRRIVQEEIDIFSRHYNSQMRTFEREQKNLETRSIKFVIKVIKDISILGRIAEKICYSATLKSSKKKGYFWLELDNEERKVLEEIIGSED